MWWDCRGVDFVRAELGRGPWDGALAPSMGAPHGQVVVDGAVGDPLLLPLWCPVASGLPVYVSRRPNNLPELLRILAVRRARLEVPRQRAGQIPPALLEVLVGSRRRRCPEEDHRRRQVADLL